MRRLVLIVALAGCEDARSHLAYPAELASAGTLLVAEPNPLSIEVLGGAAPLERAVGADGLELYLAAYPETPDHYGLEPGPLTAGTLCRPCALSEPDQLYYSRDGESFTRVDLRPDWLVEALVPDRAARCDECPVVLDAELIELPLGAQPNHFLLQPWTPDSALLLGPVDGVLGRLRASGDFEPLCMPDLSFTGVAAAFLSAEGELWVMRPNGVLSSLRLDALELDEPCGEKLVDRAPPLSQSAVRLVGPPSQEDPDLYVLTTTPEELGRLHRFSDGTWTQLAEFAARMSEPSMVYSSEGTVYAVGGSDEVLRARGSEVESLRLVRDTLARELTVVAEVSGFGVLLGDRFDALLTRTETGGFEPLSQFSPTEWSGDRPRGMVALNGGVLHATSRGEARFYDSERGYCPAQVGLFGRESAWNMVRLDGPVIFNGSANLYRATPRSSCSF